MIDSTQSLRVRHVDNIILSIGYRMRAKSERGKMIVDHVIFCVFLYRIENVYYK